MTVLAEFKLLIFIYSYHCVLSFNLYPFSSGEKPRCTGNALKPEELCTEEDIGFPRDISVDIVARNINNELKYQASKSCDKLANIKTSTCIFSACVRWKRWFPFKTGTRLHIITTAEELMEDLIEVVSKDAAKDPKLNRVNKEFVFERIIHAKWRLIKSGVVTKDSKIVGQLQNLKKYFATGNELYQHQLEYLESTGTYEPQIMQKFVKLFESDDLVSAVEQFIKHFEGENGVKITDYHVQNNVVQKFTLSGIFRLKFEYEKSGKFNGGSVILKIPSLSPSYERNVKGSIMLDREIYFYETILPALYRLGKCEPFAPKLYVATQAKALVLEDLTADGYKRADQFTYSYFDLDHSQLWLTVLAQFHAISYKYIRSLENDDSKKPMLRSQMGYGRVSQQHEIDSLCELVKASLGSSLHEKILEMAPDLLAILPTRNHLDENGMTVLVHGDIAERNILFKYDASGKVRQAKIIDWQVSIEASPLLDLIYLLVPNVTTEDVEANDGYLVNLYLDTLNQKLSQISANRVYNRDELNRDMSYFKHHFFQLLSTLAYQLLVSDMGQSYLKHYQSHLTNWVLYLDKKGII